MPTLDDLIKQILCKGGVQEAAGVEVTYPDGTKLTIHSDDHPALRRPVVEAETPEIKVVQSAQGG